jgi:hypothetical protein
MGRVGYGPAVPMKLAELLVRLEKDGILLLSDARLPSRRFARGRRSREGLVVESPEGQGDLCAARGVGRSRGRAGRKARRWQGDIRASPSMAIAARDREREGALADEGSVLRRSTPARARRSRGRARSQRRGGEGIGSPAARAHRAGPHEDWQPRPRADQLVALGQAPRTDRSSSSLATAKKEVEAALDPSAVRPRRAGSTPFGWLRGKV